MVWVRLGYCFTPYQRLRLYNGAPFGRLLRHSGIRRTYSRLKPPASPRGDNGVGQGTCSVTLVFTGPMQATPMTQFLQTHWESVNIVQCCIVVILSSYFINAISFVRWDEGEKCCLTSHATIFQLYVTAHMYRRIEEVESTVGLPTP